MKVIFIRPEVQANLNSEEVSHNLLFFSLLNKRIQTSSTFFFLNFSPCGFLFIYFWPHRRAWCGILVFWPGMEPATPALQVWSLNHWTAREVPHSKLFKKKALIFCVRKRWARVRLLTVTFKRWCVVKIFSKGLISVTWYKIWDFRT